MLKILWNSDRMIGGTSAYSKISYEMCTRTVKLGYQVAHIPMGMANRMGRQVYQGVLIYPSGSDPFNEDVILDTYLDWKADMLITLKEPWVFKHTHKLAINFVPYAIIDHSPVSPLITSKLHTAFRILVPSRFAQRELKLQGFDSVYVPHGVDTSIYKPLENKEYCRKLFYLNPDDFVVGVIARNQSRKMIPRILQAYKRFLELNPDVKSRMMLWTNVYPSSPPSQPIMGVADVGVNLLTEIYRLGLGEKVNWPDWKQIEKIGGLPEYDPAGGWDMVKLYNSMDVVMSLSGEGFWLVGLEAQACGVPVICANYAAAPEICGSGLTVDVDDYIILNTPGTRYPLCSVDKAAEALTKIMNANPEKLARRARRFAERYDWNKVVERYWKSFLEEAECELYPLITGEGVKSWR